MDADLAAAASDTVRRTVKALQGFYDIEPEEIAAALRISKATAYRKLNGESEITAGELAVLAQLFGCDIADIYAGTARFDQQRAAELARARNAGLIRRGIPFNAAAPQTHEADFAVTTQEYGPHRSAAIIEFPQVRARTPSHAATAVPVTDRDQSCEPSEIAA